MANGPFSDQNLQYVSISDFTPGIFRYSRVSTPLNYTPSAPLGSASHAYRCVARQGVGLVPLPSYRLAQRNTSVVDPAHPVCMSIGNMLSLAPRQGAVGDLVTAVITQFGTPEATTNFHVTRLPALSGILGNTTTPYDVYSSTMAGFPGNVMIWPTMDFATFRDPTSGLYARTVVTIDPLSTVPPGANGKWVSVRGWTTPSPGNAVPESSNGTFPLLPYIGSYPRIFFHENRMAIWQVGSSVTATNNIIASDNDVLYVAGGVNADMTPTTSTQAGTFFPEMGTFFGSWGSISTGELVGIYAEGGAVLVYGDLYAPNQVVKLPGVAGTMGLVSRACLTSAGLIYPRFNEGAWVWNGDNTAHKISNQIQDDVFDRTRVSNGFATTGPAVSSMAKFGPYVLFPANWLYDTLTSSWWLIEDPSTINFQVWCDNGQQGLFGSPGIAYAPAGSPAILDTQYWDFGTASTSYRWLSSPLPVTQESLVSIQIVEIVASNPTAVPATVTITPTVPANQHPLQQQSQSQPLTFTIPPTTVAYRASQRLGYADYNIQLAVDASNPSTAAPILHQLNVGYTFTRPAGIQ